MNRRDIEQRARIVLARELHVELAKVRDEADLREDLGADSLDMVHLTASLEDEFGVQVSDDEAEFCQTVGTAIDLIEAKVEQLLQDQVRRPALGKGWRR